MFGEPGAFVPDDDWWPDAYAIFSTQPYYSPVSPAVAGAKDRCWLWSDMIEEAPTTRDMGMRILVNAGEDLIRLDRTVSTDGEDVEYWWAPEEPTTYGAEPGSELSLDGHDLGIAVVEGPENVNWDELVTGLMSREVVTVAWDPPSDGSRSSWVGVLLAPALGNAVADELAVVCVLVDDGEASLDIVDVLDGYDGFRLDVSRSVTHRVEVPDYGTMLANADSVYYYVTGRNR